jgi:hypothetical protein
MFVMTHWENSWATEVLSAFTQEGATGLTPTPGEVDYLRTYARMRRGSTKLAAFGLRAALWMVALAPLWFFGRLATFSRLARRERSELLGRLLVHHSFAVRELTMLLKLTAAMALLGTSSVRARSGYDDVHKRAPIETGTRVSLPLIAAPLMAAPLKAAEPLSLAPPANRSTGELGAETQKRAP